VVGFLNLSVAANTSLIEPTACWTAWLRMEFLPLFPPSHTKFRDYAQTSSTPLRVCNCRLSLQPLGPPSWRQPRLRCGVGIFFKLGRHACASTAHQEYKTPAICASPAASSLGLFDHSCSGSVALATLFHQAFATKYGIAFHPGVCSRFLLSPKNHQRRNSGDKKGMERSTWRINPVESSPLRRARDSCWWRCGSSPSGAFEASTRQTNLRRNDIVCSPVPPYSPRRGRNTNLTEAPIFQRLRARAIHHVVRAGRKVRQALSFWRVLLGSI